MLCAAEGDQIPEDYNLNLTMIINAFEQSWKLHQLTHRCRISLQIRFLYICILQLMAMLLLSTITIFAGRNPPPFCVGTGVPLLNLCVRLYNIRVQNYNVHVCINLELQFASRPLIVVSFDCVRVGIGGVGIEKPSATRVVMPDPVRYKHTGKIISLTPDTLSAAYITMNSDWNE